jgi:hypothetical protein
VNCLKRFFYPLVLSFLLRQKRNKKGDRQLILRIAGRFPDVNKYYGDELQLNADWGFMFNSLTKKEPGPNK